MGTVNYDNMWQVNQARREELMSEAESERALRSAHQSSEHPAQWRVELGKLLVEWGAQLQSDYKPAAR